MPKLAPRSPRLVAPIMAAAALIAVAGCTDTIRQMRGTTDAYDGAWVGQIQVVTRTTACRISRGGVRATVAGGVIEGVVRQATGEADFGGFILESGEVADGLLDAEFDADSGVIEGRFDGAIAEGTFRTEDCSGVWDLRKIR